MTRSDSVNTIKGSYITRRSCRPFRSSAEVVESTVVVGGVVFTIAALTTKNIQPQSIAFTFNSKTDCHTVLFFVTYISDTSCFVKLATCEERLPIFLEVIRIDLPYRAVACTRSTTNEETSVLREADVLQVELVVTANNERSTANNVKTTIVRTYRLEVSVECEESTRSVSREHAAVIVSRTSFGDENLSEALACWVVVNSQTIRRGELVAVAYLDNIECALACNGNLISESRRVVTKLASRNHCAVRTGTRNLNGHRVTIAEANLSSLCLGIEVEGHNNILANKVSIEVECKCVELRIGLLVDVLATIEVNDVVTKQVRSSIHTERLEPSNVLALAAIQLPSNLTACQLLRSNLRAGCSTKLRYIEYIRYCAVVRVTADSIAFI